MNCCWKEERKGWGGGWVGGRAEVSSACICSIIYIFTYIELRLDCD